MLIKDFLSVALTTVWCEEKYQRDRGELGQREIYGCCRKITFVHKTGELFMAKLIQVEI